MRAIILDNIRSLHNVGAIFRSADGAGWDKIFLCGYTGCPPDRRIEKVSLGAEKTVKWESCENITDLVTRLKKDGFFIIALETGKNSADIFQYKNNAKKVALIVGNEVDGINSTVLDLADVRTQIPMRGTKESLNVSVATGIALYALR